MNETAPVVDIQISDSIRRMMTSLEEELAGVIVGQRTIVRGVLTALLAGGHVLLEGVPGLGKTLLVRTLAECMNLTYSRIQFTPDLMPADIVGTDVIIEEATARAAASPSSRGPIFANLILADEINRATPRTQSAMLEAMQEHAVTVGRQTHRLPQPFFVLATQNPIDLQGTYPSARSATRPLLLQADRRLSLCRRTEGDRPPHHRARRKEGKRRDQRRPVARPAGRRPRRAHRRARARLRRSPGHGHPPRRRRRPARKLVRYGASPRAIQALVLAGKMNAILSGRYNVSYEDLRRVVLPALRHRLVLNVEAQLQNIDTDTVLNQILAEVK